jgi:DNA-binding YbaB/EbfC family protein
MSDQKMPDFSEIMNMAQKLQGDMQRVQRELENKTAEATSGGGMVTAVINGRFELVSLTIDPNVVDPNDKGMLEDLIVAAVNQAVERIRETTRNEMSKLSAGLPFPGMP